MKAVSLMQPWATLISIRAKKIETRNWSTNFRGPLAIHASMEKKYIDMRSKHYICHEEPFYHVLTEYYQPRVITPWYILPKGMVVAICDLMDCKRILSRYFISDQEKAFGDYTPGRYMWFLENIRELKHPIPAKGALGLWNWTPPQNLEFK